MYYILRREAVNKRFYVTSLCYSLMGALTFCRVCPALSNAFAKRAFAKVVLPTEKLLAVDIDGGVPTDVFFDKVEDEVSVNEFLLSSEEKHTYNNQGTNGSTLFA